MQSLYLQAHRFTLQTPLKTQQIQQHETRGVEVCTYNYDHLHMISIVDDCHILILSIEQ